MRTKSLDSHFHKSIEKNNSTVPTSLISVSSHASEVRTCFFIYITNKKERGTQTDFVVEDFHVLMSLFPFR